MVKGGKVVEGGIVVVEAAIVVEWGNAEAVKSSNNIIVV